MLMKVESLGQVFTPPAIVTQMLSLRQNAGRALEPACGSGVFSSQMPGAVALELDPDHAPAGALVMDFFEYPLTEQFDSIIGNPPYVRHQAIVGRTRALLDYSLFDKRTNLFLFFIEKCVKHLSPGGELIFIVPREFAKATAAACLNDWLYSQGSMTHYIELGDSRVFAGAAPNTVIFRFEKGRFDRHMADGRVFEVRNGQMLFATEALSSLTLGDLFEVRVGAVSGADELFAHPEGNLDFVTSKTVDTGQTIRMIFNEAHPALDAHKERLLRRRIRRFTEDNWWAWGRGYPKREGPRIYVNAKTRRPRPFYVHEATAFDGSVLALFPRDPAMMPSAAAAILNALDWTQLGFKCDGRFLFSQRSLEACPLPVAAVWALKAISGGASPSA